MKKYCFDTSGLSNPIQDMPEDIHKSLWSKVQLVFESGTIAVTTEIYQELCNTDNFIGQLAKTNETKLILEIGNDDWDWPAYIKNSKRMQEQHKAFISEYNGGKKDTIGLNDLSIITLAKTLNLPLVSMEKRKSRDAKNKQAIPDICDREKVQHMTFTDFLRAESIKA